MKGALITFSLLFIFLPLFFLPTEAFAATQDFCIDSATGVNNNNPRTFLDSGKGFVPCGISNASPDRCITGGGAGTTPGDSIPCNHELCTPNLPHFPNGLAKCRPILLDCPCQIGHLFLMGYKIYKFALEIVILIAGLMLVVGGILMMISGGMPAVYQIAKKMIIYSMVGIVVVLASWVIVNTVFLALGYSYTWTLPGLS